MIGQHTKRFYFVGLAGAGMASIARVLLRFGYEILGWDDAPDDTMIRLLSQEGAQLKHWTECPSIDCVVYSTAIPAEHPALAWARRELLPIYHRSDVLAWLSHQIPTIAVCGSHGKTTTTSLVHHILNQFHIPHVVILGGILNGNVGGVADEQPKYLVIEACESDRTFLKYHPTHVILTNISHDHLEYYHNDIQELIKSFADWINQHRPSLFWSCDDRYIQQLHAMVSTPSHSVGKTTDAAYVWSCLLEGLGSQISMTHGTQHAQFKLPAPGEFNAANAALALALADAFGLNIWDTPHLFQSYQRVGRRFEYQCVHNDHGMVHWIHDYGHHPNEIRAVIQTVRHIWPGQSLRMVFEPHRYTRTHALMSSFAEVLSEVDELVLLPIYAAAEAPIDGVHSEALARLSGSHCRTTSFESLTEMLEQWPHDGILIFQGAGHIHRCAHTWLEQHRAH